MNLGISPHSQKRETCVGEYGKYGAGITHVGSFQIYQFIQHYSSHFFFFSNIVIRNMIKL